LLSTYKNDGNKSEGHDCSAMPTYVLTRKLRVPPDRNLDDIPLTRRSAAHYRNASRW
jgi:hypothetical protein